MRNPKLLLCLLLSGFAGLAYELLWVRLLSHPLGWTTMSFSAVLAVFFGGLAVGAIIGGRKANGLRHPLRAYAILELAVAVVGLALYPVLAGFDGYFASIDPGPGTQGAALRVLTSVLLLSPATLLMGATLPVAIRALTFDDDSVGSSAALAYGINTVGAFLGAYGVTFHLLPEFGVMRSVFIAVSANVLAAATALLLSRTSESAVPLESHANVVVSAADAKLDKPRTVARAVALLGGFSAVSLQVVWVRLFSTFVGGTLQGTGSVLVAVLIGIGLGSLLIVPTAARSSRPGLWFVGLQAVTMVSICLLSLAMPWLAYQLSALAWERTGDLVPAHGQLILIFIALAVPTTCSGASFPLLLKLIERSAEGAPRSLGSLYGANTVGSIIGSLATAFVLLPEFGSEATMFLGIVVLALAAVIAAVFLAEGAVTTKLAICLPCVALLHLYPGINIRELVAQGEERQTFIDSRTRARSQAASLVYFAEGDVATVAVKEERRGRGLRLNGLGQGSISRESPRHLLESALVAFVPLAHHEKPQRALVVGLGAGATVEILRDQGVGHIDVIELERRVAEAAKFVGIDSNPLDAANVHLHIDDARHFLLRQAKQHVQRYDIITSMPAHPWVASSIFTREFFAVAAENLLPQGIFSTWFGLDRMDTESTASLVRAFAAVFPYFIVYHIPEVGAYFLVGSPSPIALLPGRASVVAAHATMVDHDAVRRDGHLFLGLRAVGSGEPGVTAIGAGPVNTDDTPIVEVRASRASTAAANLDGLLLSSPLPTTAFPAEARAELIDQLLESSLGSPRGLIPLRTRPLRRKYAERMLAASRGALSPERLQYFEARLRLLDGDPSPARALVARPELDAVIRGRLERVLATTASGRDLLRHQLMALPPAVDVLLALAGVDLDAALARVDPERPPEDDPAAMILWLAAFGAPNAESRRLLSSAVGDVLNETDQDGPLGACEIAARRVGVPEIGEMCVRRRVTLRDTRGKALRRRGIELAADGRFADAAAKLREAASARPGDVQILQSLLRVSLRLDDPWQTKRLVEELRAAGVRPSRLTTLLVPPQQSVNSSEGLDDDSGLTPSGAP